MRYGIIIYKSPRGDFERKITDPEEGYGRKITEDPHNHHHKAKQCIKASGNEIFFNKEDILEEDIDDLSEIVDEMVDELNEGRHVNIYKRLQHVL